MMGESALAKDIKAERTKSRRNIFCSNLSGSPPTDTTDIVDPAERKLMIADWK